MKWEGPQAGLYMAIKSVANANKFFTDAIIFEHALAICD